MAKTTSEITLYHSPYTRSVSIRWLLEELGVKYKLQVTNIHNPSSVSEEYRAIQPHKKVPAVLLDGQIITERAAIATYLADRFSMAHLAPSLDDKSRSAYLSMLVYVDAIFDPCVSAHIHNVSYKPSDYSFGAYDDVMAYLEKTLSARPYAAGDQFTAADTQLASALEYTMMYRAIPELPVFVEYLGRATNRPAHKRTRELDAALAREMGLPGSESTNEPAVAMTAPS